LVGRAILLDILALNCPVMILRRGSANFDFGILGCKGEKGSEDALAESGLDGDVLVSLDSEEMERVMDVPWNWTRVEVIPRPRPSPALGAGSSLGIVGVSHRVADVRRCRWDLEEVASVSSVSVSSSTPSDGVREWGFFEIFLEDKRRGTNDARGDRLRLWEGELSSSLTEPVRLRKVRRGVAWAGARSALLRRGEKVEPPLAVSEDVCSPSPPSLARKGCRLGVAGFSGSASASDQMVTKLDRA
jgi:hypothetical protein